ncbi:hypothetical protein PANI_CDS0059 [Maribacter phage Panino]
MSVNKRQVDNRRAEAIFAFCDKLHEDIDNLYELMVDGTDEEEKKHIESIIDELRELNLDR